MNQKILHLHFLDKHDYVIDSVLEKYGLTEIKSSKLHFERLVESVVCQQLSEKAGATIWKRLQDMIKPDSVTPEIVQKKSVEDLRKSGVSYAKAGYIKNIANAFIAKTVEEEKFNEMTDDQVIAQLSSIKGVGKWTAEMFLIFSLGREDVFSYGDAGLNRAIYQLYGKGKKLPLSKVQKIVKKWIPYRSYASLLLWRSLENKKI